MACRRYYDDRGLFGWRMLFRSVPKESNAVSLPSTSGRDKQDDLYVWLGSDEAKGFYAVQTRLPADCNRDEYGNRWSEHVLYTFIFTDADTAFAFKMRFG